MLSLRTTDRLSRTFIQCLVSENVYDPPKMIVVVNYLMSVIIAEDPYVPACLSFIIFVVSDLHFFSSILHTAPIVYCLSRHEVAHQQLPFKTARVRSWMVVEVFGFRVPQTATL